MDSPKENKSNRDDLYYSALVNAFINNKLSKDKSLLTLSAGAIGLLVTLLTTIGAKSRIEVILYFLAFLSFLITIIMIIKIFDLNANFCYKLFQNEDLNVFHLKVYDFFIFLFFLIGVILSFFIGIRSGLEQFQIF